MRRLLIPVVALLAISACGGDASSTTTGNDDSSGPALTIQGRSFGAAPEVAPGATFTIVNQDGVRHTVTSPDDLWEEVSVAGGETATFTVPSDLAAGTYDFVCAVHPDMGGRLNVTG